MTGRLDVTKTYKLFIGGGFPRSESGRALPIRGPKGAVLAHVSRASRKDLRDAVSAARQAQEGWASATPYLRAQILYRMAEMLEGKRDEFVRLIAATALTSTRATGGKARAEREVGAAIDQLVCYSGWADKYAQVLGCNNPVAGPYYNFTTPEPTGVVGVIAPDSEPLLALVALLAPPLCAGNTIVALGSEAHPLATAVLGEVCATSDVPPGVVNLLTGSRAELVPHFASHRDLDALHAADLPPDQSAALRAGIAENLKRVTVREVGAPGESNRKGGGSGWYDEAETRSPWWIEPFVEFKTVWHPSGA